MALVAALFDLIVKAGLGVVDTWLVGAAYFTWCERRPAGQTVGKRVLHIRVVDDVTG